MVAHLALGEQRTPPCWVYARECLVVTSETLQHLQHLQHLRELQVLF